MNIIEALRDPRLFGGTPTFRDLSTWRRWLVFLSAVYGLPLSSEEQATFRRFTGRTVYAPPRGGWREAVAVVGRQSGKTRVAGVVAGIESALAEKQPDGTEIYSLLLAQDQRAVMRTLFAYAVAP